MLAGSALIAAVAYAGPSFAQEAAGTPPQSAEVAAEAAPATPADARVDAGVGDIVVTARRVQEKLQDIPVAVSALSGAQLTQQGIREIRDLNAMVPNVSIQQGNTGAGTVYITIRGQTLSNILLTIDPSVGTYLDGVNIPRPYGLRAGMVDIGRVEVLRGPQGTLYGKNTTGGAISLYTADPTGDLNGKVEVSAGNYNAYNVNGVLNVPLGQDLAARFVVQRSRHDPYNRSNVTGIGTAKDDTWYGRAKLKYSGEKLTAVLTGDITDLDTGGGAVSFRGPSTFGTGALVEAAVESGINPTASTVANLTPAQQAAALAVLNQQRTNDFYRNNSNYTGSKGTYKGQSVNLDLTWELSDYLKVRSITGYRHFNTVYSADGDATAFIINESRQPTKDKFFSQELQLLGGNDTLNWVAGLYYSRETGNLTEISRTTPFVALNAGRAPVTITNTDILSKSIGAFAQANLHITDRLTLTGGARWTEETKQATLHGGSFSGIGNADLTGGFGTFTCGVAVNGVTLPANNCSRTLKDKFRKPSWLASADYKLAQDVLVYAKFATGFKGGGQQPRTTGRTEGAYRKFDPETITEYEVGFKSELFDRKVRFNVAAFIDKYKDIQKNQFVVPPITLIANATSATIKGVEAELVVRPTRELTLTANGGYLHARYGKDQDPACTTFYQTGCFFGQKWPAPTWNYTLGARYVMPTSMGDLSTNVNWSWQDDLVLVPDVPDYQLTGTQKAYGLLSARIGLNIDDWDAEIALFGRNLLDKEYYSGAIRFQALGFANGFTGEPRTYGIQFTKRFGGL
jgi:iron complex outermembrane receptor protein